ncbi:hypothetical protein FY034_02490 [Trichlorobacter lovleyi]|uniref:alpha/beta hydrolase n=1 Tax=Trichlorobacter lovleyi TaxID=313985 RepID=UPI00223EF30E|nr:lipase family protein [Trichlorobacter lovleyi]QOX77853.1 hypothetical protein FY034_02490 [Trichlorobacter lovleyi]
MFKKRFQKFAALACALILTVLAGCGSDDVQTSRDPAVLVSAEKTATFSSITEVEQALFAGGADQLTISSTLGGYDTLANATKNGATGVQPINDLINLIKSVWNEGFLPYTRTPIVHLYKITYKQSPQPNAPNLTGLLMLPYDLLHNPRGVLLFTHPTETLRAYSPSRKEPFIDGTMTKMFGYLFATLGYAVVMPDYPGMGDNYETHPYCLTTLGSSSAAMVKAVRSNKDFGLSDYIEVNIMGFSEGGYAALASAYYMKNYPADYMVKKVASLSGPYDLAGTMKNLMISAGIDFPAPYFLPYVINGYRAAYPAISYLDFSNAVVANPVIDGLNFNSRLLALLNGDYTGSQISTLIYTVTPASKDNKYYGPISITTLDFQKHLVDEPDSDLNKALAANTLAQTAWLPDPNVKFFFAHYEGDDCVPYGNTLAMQKVWGTYSNVTFTKLTSTEPFNKANTGSTHAASLVREYVLGMQFLLGM